MLNISQKIKLCNVKRYGDKKACIYFVITSMHKAISLLVKTRTPHYTYARSCEKYEGRRLAPRKF